MTPHAKWARYALGLTAVRLHRGMLPSATPSPQELSRRVATLITIIEKEHAEFLAAEAERERKRLAEAQAAARRVRRSVPSCQTAVAQAHPSDALGPRTRSDVPSRSDARAQQMAKAAPSKSPSKKGSPARPAPTS